VSSLISCLDWWYNLTADSQSSVYHCLLSASAAGTCVQTTLHCVLGLSRCHLPSVSPSELTCVQTTLHCILGLSWCHLPSVSPSELTCVQTTLHCVLGLSRCHLPSVSPSELTAKSLALPRATWSKYYSFTFAILAVYSVSTSSSSNIDLLIRLLTA